MNFPVLDRLGFPSRQRARWLASHFTDQLVSGLERSAREKELDDSFNSPSLSKSLLEARGSGMFTEKQFRDNVTVLFVAGQENPQLAIVSTLYLLAKHPEIQEDLRKEADLHDQSPGATITQEALQSMPLLAAVTYESLRLFPPIGQLINRRVSQPVRLGGDIILPEGTYVGYNSYSTNRDPEAWGAGASEFKPSRWGATCQDIQKEYRRRRSRAEFISFHGGQRACLGERFALLQLKATLYVLVRTLRWRLDPTWPDRMTPAGPLCPRNLHLVFEQLQKDV
ncbi:cytochrome P450-dit2 [Conoideocrella luteorostrata]|uniref:Cytochrome P450-dit2 n=1 Tax=Conoideocrella luteorostrata TaxID=1105319 RepID=A0AAJ0FS50_9HYPO|nr:cytochrome P450-dit2 [Conoideocrella luteorostrata]